MKNELEELKLQSFKLSAEVYADADNLRRKALLEGDMAGAKIMRKIMISTSQKVFEKGFTLAEFIAEIERYEATLL